MQSSRPSARRQTRMLARWTWTATRWSRSLGRKDLDVTVVTQNFDDNTWSVSADKKIRGDIVDPQIFDAEFVQIQRQTGIFKANLSFSSPHLKSETGL